MDAQLKRMTRKENIFLWLLKSDLKFIFSYPFTFMFYNIDLPLLKCHIPYPSIDSNISLYVQLLYFQRLSEVL